MERYSKFVSVLVDHGIERPLDYAVPEEHASKIKKGMQVRVPLKGVLRTGYVFAVSKV